MRTMAIRLMILAGCFGVLLIPACGGSAPEAEVGGLCTYGATQGTANCIGILDEPSGQAALVSFVPDDPEAPARYRYKTDDSRLRMVNPGAADSTNWLRQTGIKIGWVGTCIRHELITGTCVPIVFEFPGLKGVHATRAPVPKERVLQVDPNPEKLAPTPFPAGLQR